MSKAIGIDFGTSNSAVGTIVRGKPHLIAVEDGKDTIPSALFFDTEHHRTLFGRAAIAAYVDHAEGRLLRALKSVLGSSLIEDTTQIGKTRVSFKHIIGDFLGHLKQKAEAELNSSIDSVVLGRPVWFVDDNPEADALAQKQLEQAARARGFKHIAFQYEPIAAALDYEQSVTQEELALIVDIGGGTSDFSIVRVAPERRNNPDRKADILANTGVHIGGTDLDRRLSLNQVMPLFGYKTQQQKRPELDLPASIFNDLATGHKIALLTTNKALHELKQLHYGAARQDLVERLIAVVEAYNGHRLAGDVERAKIILSAKPKTELALPYVEEGLTVTLNKKRFEEDAKAETQKIAAQITACLADAGLKAAQIQTLFLTGGTTAIPSVTKACRSKVPAARIVEGDKFGSVGTGLALDAGIKFGK